MLTYINGEIVEAAEARVSVEDAGFSHAVGLFETMAVYGGKVFRLDAHLERLAGSAKVLGLMRDVDVDGLRAAVEQAVAANKVERARVRLTVTPGSASLLKGEEAGPRETVVVTVSEPTAYAPEYFEKGVMVMVGPGAANPFDALAGHKTLSYWGRLRTLRQAASAGAGEVVWLSVTNHLASGAVSNLFLVKDGALLTPIARGEEVQGALPAPVLPGVTRAVVVALAEASGRPVMKQMLTVNDLLEADEVFLTNSSWQVLPVSKVEKHAVGKGEVGEVTREVMEGVMGVIERECGGGGMEDG